MNLQDYLIDQTGEDWAELLKPWAPIIPCDLTVWMVNRVGDVFAVEDDSTVHLLDVGSGTYTHLADSRDDFCIKIDQDDNADQWLLIDLVNTCVADGKTLKPRQCYSFKVPPILGGQWTSENLEPTDLSVHYAFLGDIFRQTKDLPDGTKIRLVVEP